jgi:hypothetical protein
VLLDIGRLTNYYICHYSQRPGASLTNETAGQNQT